MCDLLENNNLPNDIQLYNAIPISDNNIAICRDKSKCIDCGLCKTICENREGIIDICNDEACVNCGQCIQVCPVGALKVKDESHKFLEAKQSGRICIALIAPAVRVAIGEAFNMPLGSFVQGKLVSALKKIGFDYVLDVTSAADLTIVEEAAEFVRRYKNNHFLPMFTSCCPSWVKYAELFYPELIPNLSTCKSPISMEGTIVKSYFSDIMNLDSKQIFTVAITPCTSKKYEISRPELIDTDLVLTAKEIISLLKNNKIDFASLEDSNFDSLLGEGSGAGMLFGSSGGVTESAIRTIYKILTNKNLSSDKLEFLPVRGMKNIKECSIDIDGNIINIAVINQMSSATPILNQVKQGKCKYHFIEIMNCLGGCIGGGGLPKYDSSKEMKIKLERINALHRRDRNQNIREAHRNPDIIKLYNEYLEHPLSKKSESLLHTYYKDQSNNK